MSLLPNSVYYLAKHVKNVFKFQMLLTLLIFYIVAAPTACLYGWYTIKQ